MNLPTNKLIRNQKELIDLIARYFCGWPNSGWASRYDEMIKYIKNNFKMADEFPCLVTLYNDEINEVGWGWHHEIKYTYKKDLEKLLKKFEEQ